MANIYGWAGKILRVDLSRKIIGEEKTVPKYSKFIGGKGIGLKAIWDEAPTAKAFDPENRIVFAAGPLTGTLSPTSARWTVTSVSPQTYPKEQVVESSVGGFWGAELKYAGYDAVIVHGVSETPVYLWIHDGEAEIRDARNLWGLDAFVTQQMIQGELGGQVEVACIGPAGENLVRVSVIIHGTGHAAGQGGFGAVMGSKNLKAISVRGTGAVKIARPKEFAEAVDYTRRLLGAAVHFTLPIKLFWVFHQDPHDLSRQAYRSSYLHQRVPWFTKYATVQKNTACHGCPVACYNYLYVPKAGAYGGGDGQCSAFFYARSRNEDVWKAKQLCERLGLSYTFVGEYTNWLMWLREFGILMREEKQEAGASPSLRVPGAVQLQRPSEKFIEAFLKELKRDVHSKILFSHLSSEHPGEGFIKTLMEQIAYRRGLGAILAEGYPRAAEKLGILRDLLDREEMHYGGHGMEVHDGPRDGGMVWDLVLAMENRDPTKHDNPGLYHYRYCWDPAGGMEWEKIAHPIAERLLGSKTAISPQGIRGPYHPSKARFAALIHKKFCLKDSLTFCDWHFPIYVSPLKERQPPYCGDLTLESKLFSAATGVDVDMDGLDKIGERIWNLQRAITMLEWKTMDMRKQHDVLLERFFVNKGLVEKPIDRKAWERAKDDYYKELNWDLATGAPTREGLEKLALKDVADRLNTLGMLPRNPVL